MNQKTKIIKTAKICKNISKAFYILNCIACTVFIALAIILPSTNAIKSISKTECAIVFGVLALYAFFLIGLLWNVESAFRETEKNQTPFCARVTHYLKKTAVFIILVSLIPALIGSIISNALTTESIFVYRIEPVGICSGIVLLLFAMIFNYGNELQQKDDETLWSF